MCLGMVFFGLGTLIWFYLDYVGANVLFPSVADIFYILQFPFSIIGLILIFETKFIRALGKGLFVFLLTLSLVLVFSMPFSNSFFDLAKFLIFYFPIEDLLLCLFSLFVFIRVSKSEKNLSWLVFTFLGFLTWFVGDLFFLYEVLNNSFYSASYADFLYFTGVFFAFLGVVSWLETTNNSLSISEDGLTMFRQLTYKIPTSLNVHL